MGGGGQAGEAGSLLWHRACGGNSEEKESEEEEQEEREETGKCSGWAELTDAEEVRLPEEPERREEERIVTENG